MTDIASSLSPIACSLTAADYRRRLDDAGQLAKAALRRREPLEGGARLTFADEPEVEQRLTGFVAAELRCCPFLTLKLERVAGELVLDVTGPNDAAPIIEELFA
jgi:hypothetical protein